MQARFCFICRRYAPIGYLPDESRLARPYSISAMINRAPSLGRLTLALLCLAVLIGLFYLVRCTPLVTTRSTSANVQASNRIARLAMLNCGDCEWQIVIKPRTGGDAHIWKVPQGKTLDIELAGGEYAVEQTMLIESAQPDSTRRFSMQLEAGQFYRWRLMTLLSGARDDALAAAATKDGHE